MALFLLRNARQVWSSPALIVRLRGVTSLPPSVLHVNTKVAKDVILFKYENPKFFRILNTFGVIQFGMMIYMANFVHTSLRDTGGSGTKAADEGAPWWRRVNLGQPAYRRSFSSLCAVLGVVVLLGGWALTLRSVRFLVLRKGGQTVSFVTYTPFGQNRIITVPLDKVCAKDSRALARVQLPVKVQGHALHYVLDMKGNFVRGDLFDASVGLSRSLK